MQVLNAILEKVNLGNRESMQVVDTISDSMRGLLPRCPAYAVSGALKTIPFLRLTSSGSFFAGSTKCFPAMSSNCFWIQNYIGGDKFERFLEKDDPEVISWFKRVLENTPKQTVQTMVQKLYSPVANVIVHDFWKEGEKFCESLTVTGSNELVKQCHDSDGLPLLSQVCGNSYLSSIAKVSGVVIGAGALYKAVQNLRAGNKMRALLWTALSAASFASPSYIEFA